jgi:hypothetical protein
MLLRDDTSSQDVEEFRFASFAKKDLEDVSDKELVNLGAELVVVRDNIRDHVRNIDVDALKGQVIQHKLNVWEDQHLICFVFQAEL